MLFRILTPLAAVMALAGTSASAATLYSANFSGGVVPAGLTGSTTVQTSPSGQQFVELAPNGGTATLTLDTTGYTAVNLDFNLYTIRSVDGSNTDYGPDPFRVEINGATVLDATFANFYAWAQSYPVAGSPSGTGSVATGALGYPEFFGYDHTYNFSFAIGTPGPSTVIKFMSFATQPTFDESYGVDNIVVTGTPGIVVTPTNPVPEPSVWALLIMGFGGAGAMLRASRRRAVAS